MLDDYEYQGFKNDFNCYIATIYLGKENPRKVLIHTERNVPGIDGIPTCSCINKYETYIIPDSEEIGSFRYISETISGHCLFETPKSLDELNKKYKRKSVKKL